MLTLRFAKPVIKTLLKMPVGIAKRMRAELEAVAANPAAYRGDWKPLHGSDFWRLRGETGGQSAMCGTEN